MARNTGGIRASISPAFLFLVAWLNYCDRQGVVPPALLACALHELGHLVVIRMWGGDIREIHITVIGAEMKLERPLGYGAELVCAGAGPAVNLMLAGISSVIPGGVLFAGLNLILALFNLLPVSGLDGGRMLYCAASLLLGPLWAERISAVVDRTLCALLLCSGVAVLLLGGTPTLLLTALWAQIRPYQRNKGERVGKRVVFHGENG